jgi:phage anti-repressor protein
MNITVFNQKLAQQLVNSDNQFPVDFELAWQWMGYTRKERALNKLKKHFEQDIDFCTNYCKTPLGGRPSLSVFLTIDCFKSLGMMAGTEQGKSIRKYFLNCEKIVKAVSLNTLTPQTYIEALKALVASEEAKEILKLENKQLEEDNLVLATAVDELFDYSSILRVAKFNNISESNFKWQHLKAVTLSMGLEIKKVPSPRYANGMNLYPHDAWRVAYPNVMLPETTTLRVYQSN